jgi:hypothetical protein
MHDRMETRFDYFYQINKSTYSVVFNFLSISRDCSRSKEEKKDLRSSTNKHKMLRYIEQEINSLLIPKDYEMEVSIK